MWGVLGGNGQKDGKHSIFLRQGGMASLSLEVL